MNQLQKKGRIQTVLISISILLVSLHTIFYYNSILPEVTTQKIAQQIVRFVLTIFLLIMIYKGKNWARVIFLILFSIGVLGAMWGLFFVEQDIITKIPFIVMAIVYSISIYHFGISKSFRAFASFQNKGLFDESYRN